MKTAEAPVKGLRRFCSGRLWRSGVQLFAVLAGFQQTISVHLPVFFSRSFHFLLYLRYRPFRLKGAFQNSSFIIVYPVH